MNPLELVLRWAHILPAATLSGGLIYQWIQVTSWDDDEERQESSRKRWSKIVMICALLLLVSGLANTARVSIGFALPMHYHILLLVKILLAFGVFYLSSLLAGRSETAKKFQADRGKWLKVTALMVIAIVLLGSVMKVSDRKPKSENDEATSQADDATSSQTMIGRNG
ncbi:MAG: hypothetical protein VB878_04490 [Pirellulaceae bacterium]